MSGFSYSAFKNDATYNPGTGWVRRTYGDGADHEADDRAQLVTDRSTIDGEFSPDVDVFNRYGHTGLYVPQDDVIWTPPYVGSVYQVAQLAGAVWRPQHRLVKTDGAVASGDASFSVSSALDDVRGRLNTYVSRGFTTDFGANKDRALLTLRLDHDLRYFFWISDPTWLLTGTAAITGAPQNTISWTYEDHDTVDAPAPWYTISIEVVVDRAANWQSLTTARPVTDGSYVDNCTEHAGWNYRTYRVFLVDGLGVKVMFKTTTELAWQL